MFKMENNIEKKLTADPVLCFSNNKKTTFKNLIIGNCYMSRMPLNTNIQWQGCSYPKIQSVHLSGFAQA